MANVTRQSSGVTFDLRTEPPLKEFQYRINRFTEGISDWSTFFQGLGVWFKARMGETFGSEGSASGGKWADLTTAYAAWKQEHYPGRPIGVLTGALRASMTGGGGYSETIHRTDASFGMSDSSKARPYGVHFSERRPVLRMPAKWGRETQKLTHEWLIAEARGSMHIGGSGFAGVVRAREAGA
jgi:hypothetical protein